MSIYLLLFLTFLKIGAVSFGGGYGMISLVREEVLQHGWLTEEQFVNMIAVSESTPGPIAINMATFIGSMQAGIWGSVCATLGVVLPSFIIILLIASVINNFLKYKGVKSVLWGIKPAVAGLITATGITMFLSALFNISNINSTFTFDYKALIVLAVVLLTSYLYKRITNKKISAIILILISAFLGIILYSF